MKMVEMMQMDLQTPRGSFKEHQKPKEKSMKHQSSRKPSITNRNMDLNLTEKYRHALLNKKWLSDKHVSASAN